MKSAAGSSTSAARATFGRAPALPPAPQRIASPGSASTARKAASEAKATASCDAGKAKRARSRVPAILLAAALPRAIPVRKLASIVPKA